ncbi:MAG: sulfotransferase [Spirochaetales bacterium]|uniref:Sulfotransferase n=1 Tax=Candidatus Thalassospirochaeta sargassi TaxID=3119039 RepID=A0AAJ1IE28_9SPIO|nr:sulfotransferase [Spirochaetales bacterium]
MAVSRKHCIFLSSTGRTGTKFFGETMSRMIEDCVSVHEPDTTRVSMPGDWIRKMAKFGVPKMLWGQYRECYSFGKLSTTRHRGITGDDKVRQYIIDNRLDYIEGFRKGLYIESNHIVYGVLDQIVELFPNSKIIWVMRDPRTWVRSAINSNAYHLYSMWDWDSINLSVRAFNFPDDPSAGRWRKMSKFEKYCWYYTNINNRAFELMEKCPNVRIFRYEDLFNKDKREQYFTQMLDYATGFDDGFKRDYTFKPELLDIKIHAAASKRLLPKWQKWNSGMADAMNFHCGEIMKRFGYGDEAEWLEKLSNTDSIKYRA